MSRPLGNNLLLGHALGNQQQVSLTARARSTHLYCCGATGSGKTKFLESLLRQDIKARFKGKCGLLLLDPHGSLYDSILRWLAWRDIPMPVVPIDLRRTDWVVGYDVLRQRPKSDPSVVISNFVQAMAYVWGQSGTQDTPLFARWASNVLGALYEKNLTLLQAEVLLDRVATGARVALTQGLRIPSMASDWAYANRLSPKDFDIQVSSTLNRMRSFGENQTFRRMFGQDKRTLDFRQVLDEGQIVLVSLATDGGRISGEDASLFATLLLSDLWNAARERGKSDHHNPFYVYIDEFQNFVTPTIAKNLDEARGYGLHLTLAHQFPRQLLHQGAHGQQVYDSVFNNARTKAVFAVEGEDDLKPLAQWLFRGVMNPEEIKHALYSTRVIGYREELRTISSRSHSTATSEGQQFGEAGGGGSGSTEMFPIVQDGLFLSSRASHPSSQSDSTSQFRSDSSSESRSRSESESWGESEVPMLVPQMGQELASVQFRSLEEQLFRSMVSITVQGRQEFVVRAAETRIPIPTRVPDVSSYPESREVVESYVEGIYQSLPCALKVADADKVIEDRRERYLNDFDQMGESLEPKSAKRPLT